MIGHNRIGASAYTSSTAIVQQAEKDWRFYETSLLKMDKDKGAMLEEYKKGETWRKHYKSWEDACVPLDISKRQADRLIAARKLQNGTECPTLSNKKESVALKNVEEARQPDPEPEPPEEPEKPAVHSADEVKVEPKTNGHTAKINGVPKYQLPVWKQLETTFGHSLNVADELNKKCPCPVKHALFIHQTKLAMNALNEWRESVK
jgi:hypothetical protein